MRPQELWLYWGEELGLFWPQGQAPLLFGTVILCGIRGKGQGVCLQVTGVQSSLATALDTRKCETSRLRAMVL